ncbi:MAG TPA: DUF1697 domain-containing protein [Pyrinomonadaceae bacterium]|nr:DUF1697 domain-containing protein [Pyrinomonadaceae bacterium]
MTNTTRYVAFLRGINVGGNKLIKMEALAAVFRAAGFRNVRTYIASGNVIFDSRGTNTDILAKKIEKKLTTNFGHEIAVLVYSLAELEALVELNPFGRIRRGKDVMLFVVLLRDKSSRGKLPLESRTEKFKGLALVDRAAFIVARRKKTGWFGFPNNFIEKEFGVTATTRNWSTLEKILIVASDEKNQ